MESREIKAKEIFIKHTGFSPSILHINAMMEFQALSLPTKEVSDEEIKSKHLIHTSEVLNDFFGRDKETLTMITSFVQENREDYAASVYDIVANKIRSKLSSDAVEWISVEDRLPEQLKEKVLVFFDYGDKQMIEIDQVDVSHFITHWMPLHKLLNLFQEGKGK